MSWILPLMSVELPANRAEHRRRYIKQWEADNRKKRNAYWRRYYREKYAERRAYLNQKQREYRNENRNGL